jgi:hypothetical protein
MRLIRDRAGVRDTAWAGALFVTAGNAPATPISGPGNQSPESLVLRPFSSGIVRGRPAESVYDDVMSILKVGS